MMNKLLKLLAASIFYYLYFRINLSGQFVIESDLWTSLIVAYIIMIVILVLLESGSKRFLISLILVPLIMFAYFKYTTNFDKVEIKEHVRLTSYINSNNGLILNGDSISGILENGVLPANRKLLIRELSNQDNICFADFWIKDKLPNYVVTNIKCKEKIFEKNKKKDIK